eukprot:scaffold10327_cov122-Isochrysis_galbana.AAC.2
MSGHRHYRRRLVLEASEERRTGLDASESERKGPCAGGRGHALMCGIVLAHGVSAQKPCVIESPYAT